VEEFKNITTLAIRISIIIKIVKKLTLGISLKCIKEIPSLGKNMCEKPHFLLAYIL
jgi:hypothetical protein